MKQDTVFIADSNTVASSEFSNVATDFRAPWLNMASLCWTVSESILHKQSYIIMVHHQLVS